MTGSLCIRCLTTMPPTEVDGLGCRPLGLLFSCLFSPIRWRNIYSIHQFLNYYDNNLQKQTEWKKSTKRPAARISTQNPNPNSISPLCPLFRAFTLAIHGLFGEQIGVFRCIEEVVPFKNKGYQRVRTTGRYVHIVGVACLNELK